MAPRSTLALSMIACGSLIATVAAAQPTAEGERTYTTTLTGAAEVPGPGDLDGTGTATVTVNVPKSQVCYKLTVSGIGTPTAAHIHEGAADKAGPPVVTLETPDSGTSEGCEDVSAKLAAQILARPQLYYVNVHNEEFPAGALRGQLG